ncbi:hypothetical protein EHQ53_04830 [Leptospira langatensis]|uniref:Lipoprotein n=1 Tax=Leptospira langatensis TaxID=2484983 RepID=A0A5F1ZYA3_9LEPT|nr:hypothetical protein [Leptospira langatensis]TGK00141.1 hypothetical protein EHO57_12690 [Leptospira langatensis]TGL42776.1 hypothetical protein EHQ53_04830 [Leptospira langatensis]
MSFRSFLRTIGSAFLYCRLVSLCLGVFISCAISVDQKPEKVRIDLPQYSQEIAILIPKDLRDYTYPRYSESTFKIGQSVEQAMRNRAEAQFENVVVIDSLFKKHRDINSISTKIQDIKYEFHTDALTGIFNFTVFQISMEFKFYQGKNLVKTVEGKSGRLSSLVPPMTHAGYMSADSVSKGIANAVDQGFINLLSDPTVRTIVDPNSSPVYKDRVSLRF